MVSLNLWPKSAIRREQPARKVSLLTIHVPRQRQGMIWSSCLVRPSVASVGPPRLVEIFLSCDPLSSRALSPPLSRPFIGKLSFRVPIVVAAVAALSDIDQISVSYSVDLDEGGNRLLSPPRALRNRHIRPEIQIGT